MYHSKECQVAARHSDVQVLVFVLLGYAAQGDTVRAVFRCYFTPDKLFVIGRI